MSSKELSLEIITPSSVKFRESIKAVTVPGTQGNFQVLKDHAPLISTIEIGEVKIKNIKNEELYFATSGGTFEILKNNALLLLDTIESAEEIDVERATEAQKRAQDRLSNKTESTDSERAEIALKKASNRLKIAEKRKKADISV